MEQIIATLWHNQKTISILESGSVMENGEPSKTLTSKVAYGYNGSYGWNIQIYENGKEIKFFSVGA